jgi:Calx-beta domain/RTX calcium-binding nonapeptide repeat (4 copies)
MALPTQGTQGGDTVYGTSGNDKLLGHQGNDFFDLRPSTGSDTIDGQGGIDTAIFAGRYEDYVFSFKDTGNLKTAVDGHGLSADLKQVETLWFDNATVDVATHAVQVTTVSVADAVAVNEGDINPQLAFTFTRTGDLSRSLDVAFTLDGTATAGADYTAPGTHSVHFDAGSATATLSLGVINDTLFEGPETVGVHLVADSHYNFAAGGQVNASGTILDNDPAPVTTPQLHVSNASAVEGGNLVFHVSIAAATDHDITFQAFTDTGTHSANPGGPNVIFGTATAGNLPGGDYDGFPATSYTIHAGDTSVDISVHARIDNLNNEGDETMSLRLQNASGATITSGIGNGRGVGTIVDNPVTKVSIYTDPLNNGPGGIFNQTAEGNDITFHFHRDVSTAALDVHYLIGGFPGGGATPGTDFTSLSGFNVVHFGAGQSDATVVFHAVDDGIAEGGEAFAVQFDFAANSPNVIYDGAASNAAYLAAGATETNQANIAQIVDLLV